MDRNNNSNKNIKLQIKSFLKKISLQLYFKRVNVPTVSKFLSSYVNINRYSQRTSIHQTYLVFVPFFSKQILTNQNIASTKNSQLFLAPQVCSLRRNKTNNSSTSNHPFSSCNQNPCTS